MIWFKIQKHLIILFNFKHFSILNNTHDLFINFYMTSLSSNTQLPLIKIFEISVDLNISSILINGIKKLLIVSYPPFLCSDKYEANPLAVNSHKILYFNETFVLGSEKQCFRVLRFCPS